LRVVCANCGGSNAPERKFCGECGAPLAQTCAACGAANAVGVKFCGECGVSLVGAGNLSAAGSPRLVEPPAPTDRPHATVVAELRLVSVLFADLVGFTARSAALDPEEVRELLSRYFDVCRGVIERYGGTIEKFIGDAVMAVWGAPAATEDDAERAVRAALDLVAAVTVLGAEVGAPELRARAGVLTGEAAVTLGAAGQGMVAGDLVNTASRLQAAAEPGTVLVGETTMRAAGQAIAFAGLDPLILKGKEEPVPVWQAQRVVAQRRGVGRSERAEPPFVGREEELRLLKELLHATGREQRVRLVSVTGLAGIGKSRLAWEFRKYVDGLSADVYWQQGRCPSYGEGITFWALGEMVRMRAGITEGEDPSKARTKLAASVAEFVSEPEERRWVEQALAYLLGLADAPGSDREELFSAWRTFFERIAERGTTVLVFEDLQWADPGLVDFIESIVEWSRTRALFVLTLSRPELLQRRPTWGAGQRSFTALHLEPLSPQAMAALLRGFVAGLPEGVVEQVLQRAEGVPLYAVETIRMLVDQGQLVERDGALTVTGTLGVLEIPNTLHALIASRLDGVAPEERSLLQDAAVLGQSFSVPALAAVSGRESTALAAPLRDLVRKELLAPITDPRSPERGHYAFVQGLIREVAYGTLAKSERRARHLAAAGFLEALNDEELAGVVATHYAEAHRATAEGPERDALAARAGEWLAHAGRRALALGSPGPALSYLEQALTLTDDLAGRATLLDIAGDAASRTEAYERSVAHLETAIATHRALGDLDAAGRSTARLADTLSLGLERISDAIARAEEFLEELGETGSERARADLAATLAGMRGGSGANEQALVWAEMACTIAERIDDDELLGRAIGAKSAALFRVGRHREGLMLARGRMALVANTGSLVEQAQAGLYVSIFVLDDDPHEAIKLQLESAELARRAGARNLETVNLLNAAEGAIGLGQWDEARAALSALGQRDLVGPRHAQRVLCEAMLAGLSGDIALAFQRLESTASTAESEDATARANYHLMRATVHLAAGELETAYGHAAACLDAEPSGINSPVALAIQMRTALWLGDATRAREVLVGMGGFRGRWMAAVRLTGEAGLDALEARKDEAATAYTRALAAWRALDSPLDLAWCALDRAVLRGSSVAPGSEDDEAREIFARIGATPFLARLDRARAAARKVG
jgi:class 3 adenylate cyclase/tetratricopeptide (TPR) repeat protein